MIRFLLDTCVISDLAKPRPLAPLVTWSEANDFRECGISVLTLAELRRGIELLPAGHRRDELRTWLGQTVRDRFREQIFDVDNEIAEAWGVLDARAQLSGRHLTAPDGLLLATASVHHLSVVTRNVRDFSGYDVPVINPS